MNYVQIFSKIQLFFIFLVCSQIKSSYGHVNYIIRFLGCFYITKKQWKSFASTFPQFFRPEFIIPSIFQKAFLKVKSELCSIFSKNQLFFIFLVCSHIKSSYGHVNYIIRFLGCFYITKMQWNSFANTFILFFEPEFIKISIHFDLQRSFLKYGVCDKFGPKNRRKVFANDFHCFFVM